MALHGTVLPGLVDLQCNGLGIGDVLSGKPDHIVAVSRALAAAGVTAWLPTIVSAPEETRLAALDAVAEAASVTDGARVVGVHLEGPWISAVRAGAHRVPLLAAPEPGAIDRALGRHPGLVRLVTLAPELEGGLDAIRRVVAAGAVASLGHTDATYDQAHAAVDAGARMCTHLFNAMRPLHHREPGVIGAVLADDRVVAGLIGDGVHVHPAMVAATIHAKGADAVALVSDAVSISGYERVKEVDGAARLEDGTLAGALAALDIGVRTALAAGLPLRDAVTAATRTPADVLGERFGRLEPGAPADFVVVDEGVRPTATYIAGELVWSDR